MAKILNPWVGYLDRSYQQVKDSLITRLITSNPEITDHSESNILIVIIGMFSGIAEMLNYYIDNMAREAFIATARRYTSMVRLVKLLDYRIKAANPATVDITFTFNNPMTSAGTLPLGTIVSTSNNITYTTIEDTPIANGANFVVAAARQSTAVNAANLGTTDGSDNQAFSLGLSYVDNSLSITINSETWEEQETLGLSGPLDKHFIVEIGTDGIAYVVFGDDTNGAIPPTAQVVYGDYLETSGAIGNSDINTITTLVSTLSLSGPTTITVANPLKASGGSDYEDIESIRINAPLSIRTLDRAVTKQDYADVALLAPGVSKSIAEFDCGKYIDIYIVPNGGGIAQSALLTSVLNFMNLRKMITTFLNIAPAGETEIVLTMSVTGKFRKSTAAISAEVKAALVEFGTLANQEINKSIRRSDLIALVDNLPTVDFLLLDILTTKPYPRPFEHTTALNWSVNVLPGSTSIIEWQIEYDGASYAINKDGSYVTSIAVSTLFTDVDNIVSFTINPGSYTTGDIWKFKTYAYNEDIVLEDFTIPHITESNLTINITEVNT